MTPPDIRRDFIERGRGDREKRKKRKEKEVNKEEVGEKENKEEVKMGAGVVGGKSTKCVIC